MIKIKVDDLERSLASLVSWIHVRWKHENNVEGKSFASPEIEERNSTERKERRKNCAKVHSPPMHIERHAHTLTPLTHVRNTDQQCKKLFLTMENPILWKNL
jgi:hypothetical protein